MRVLRTAWLTTNRNCNNRCNWCYAKETWGSNCMMNIDDAKLAVDELQKNGIKRIVLIGGEPTIYPNFFELLSYIREKEIPVYIPTNGRIFHNIEFAEKLSQIGINGVDISIKAVNKEEYLKNTNVDGFNQMIEGYHNLVKLGIKVTASYVITSNDEQKFDKLVELLVKENISPINIQFVKPVLGVQESNSNMSIDEMGKFVEYVYNRLKDTNINYKIEVSFPICMIDRDVLDKLIKEGIIRNCCQVPKGTGLNFDEKFKIIPCNHFAEYPLSDESINLNDFHNEVDRVLESDLAKSFRELSSSYPTVKCQTCKDWDICGGGCFTRWLTTDPNEYIT